MDTTTHASYRLVQMTGSSASLYQVNARDQVAFTEGVEPGVVRARMFDGDRIIDLGTLGGPIASAVAVNNGGQVAGLSHIDDSGHFRAFRWNRMSGMLDLGLAPGAIDSQALDLNNRGDVTGNLTFADEPSVHPFVWSHSAGMVDLGPLEGAPAVALQINEAGRIMGQASGQEAIFSWTREEGMLAIRAPNNGNILASDMNSAGQIVGRYNTPAGPRGFLWTPGAGLMDLDLAGETNAINNEEMVVGAYAAVQQAFRWTREGGFVDLGTLGGPLSVAQDVNNRGHVVGRSSTFDGSITRAFVWTPEHGMADLNTLVGNAPAGLLLTGANCINNRGSILADGAGGGLFLLLRGPGRDEPPVVGPVEITGIQDVGMPLVFSAHFTDVDLQQAHSAVWAWGDGSQDPGIVTESNGVGSVSGTHTFAATGFYTIALTVTDSGGDSTTVRLSIGVGVPSPVGAG